VYGYAVKLGTIDAGVVDEVLRDRDEVGALPLFAAHESSVARV